MDGEEGTVGMSMGLIKGTEVRIKEEGGIESRPNTEDLLEVGTKTKLTMSRREEGKAKGIETKTVKVRVLMRLEMETQKKHPA